MTEYPKVRKAHVVPAGYLSLFASSGKLVMHRVGNSALVVEARARDFAIRPDAIPTGAGSGPPHGRVFTNDA